MTSNRLFSKGMMQDFKREVSFPALYMLVFFFAIPIALMLAVSNAREESLQMLNLAQNNQSSASFEVMKQAGGVLTEYRLMRLCVQTLGMGTVSVVLGLCAVREANHQFGWLHRRREVDFYHALPQGRGELFRTRFVSGILTVTVPFAICMLLGVGYALLVGAPAGKLLRALAPALGLNLFFFLLVYTLCITAVLLTGKALTGLLGMCVLHGIAPAFSTLLGAFASVWFRTYTTEPPVLKFMFECSPIVQWLRFYDWYMDHYYYFVKTEDWSAQKGAFHLALCMLGFAVLLALNWLLYKKRALEKAGEAMVFASSEAPIRIVLALLGGMGSAAFFYNLRSTFGWAVFGMLAGVLISHCIIEIIYRNDFRRLLGHKLQLAGCALAGVLLLCMFRYDWIGYDSYLPKMSHVASAVALIDDETWPLAYYSKTENGRYQTVYSWDDDFGKGMELSDAEDLSDIEALAKLGIEETRRQWGEGAQNDAYGDAQSRVTTLRVTWVLKNGRRVHRTYAVALQDAEETYAALYASESYKQLLYPILDTKPDDVGQVYWQGYGDEQDLKLSAEQRAAFLAAYQRDLKRLNFQERRQAYPIGELGFVLGDTSAAFAESKTPELYEHGNRKSGSLYIRVNYPIYDSFEETLALLAQQGILPDDKEKLFADLTAVPYSVMAEDGHWYYGTLKDETDLALVIRNFVPEEYANWNQFGPAQLSDVRLGTDWNRDGEYSYETYSGTMLSSAVLLQNAETEKLRERMLAQAER